MMLGMSLHTFTLVHVAISFLGIGSGLIVVFGMINNRLFKHWNAVFLIFTVLTSVTGFMFPFHQVTPGIILGVISMVVLAPTVLALYSFHLEGKWRWAYAAGAVAALYFNVFVLVVQSFQKIPALTELAPTQKEPPFAITQLFVLACFVGMGVMAVKRFHPEGTAEARAATAGS